jgi:DNA helicase-2/ATP-dependent DNA helicase PcrA
LVGDPRQVTYLTHHENKHTKYRDGKIEEFIREKCTRCFDVNGIDHDILKKSYRCCSAICDLSNKLYPSFIQTIPDNHKTTEHSGIFLINQADLPSYLSKYKPTQLRWNSATLVDKSLPVFTFGKSKGLEFDRVVIYPTKPFITWLQNNSSKLEPTSRSKFYVAITRAKFSVGIVCDKNLQIDGVEKYIGKQTIQKQSLPIQNKQAYTRQLSLFEEKDSLTN